MSFKLLFKDELRGFYKSNVMLVLWIGMPIFALLMNYLNPDTEGLSLSILIGLVIASISGTLAAVMLSTSIVGEINRKVYDLFLIRPVKRSHIILAKFCAVYLCLIIATMLSLGVGFAIDQIANNTPSEIAWESTKEALAFSLAAMAIACAIGIFIGLLVNSVPLAAILAVYLGNQLSLISVLPSIMLEELDPLIFAPSIGIVLTSIFLIVDTILFNRKQF